jgi:beta-glucanase (GH16 family)
MLVWSDEFNGATLDESSWTREIGGGGWGNNELQYYTDRTVNSYLENGVLVIKAMQESYGGRNYTSARLKTQGKKFFKYGKIEARMRLPYGQGIWPAFWTLGESISSVGWPACGEIDIMEMLGHESFKSYGTTHWDNNGQHAYQGGSYSLSSGTFSDSYHLFSIIWDEQSIRWYVDDNLFYTISITSPSMSELRENHFIILNVAVGGNWPGYPDPTTVFPQYMYIDYVRVYKDTSAGNPVVNILSPEQNANFPEGSDINILADVSGFVNLVQYVEFYQGDARIGIDSQEPYSFNWQGVYEGAYTITAKAKDYTGLVVSSESVDITVGQGYSHSPYLGRPVMLPGVIEMENYDLGGEGIAYHDSDPFINQGNQYGNYYRMDEGVDLQPTTDAGGGHNLGWAANGEWVKYYIEVSQSGYYKLTSRVASPNSNGVFRIDVDGIDKTGNIAVPLTGDWQNWTNVFNDNIYLEEGVHILTFHVINSGFNINKIIVSYSTTDIDDDTYNPECFRLYNNYPNPFNSSTKIKFELPQISAVELKISNVLGQLIATIIKEQKPVGFYEVDFNGADLPSGVYIYRIQAGDFVETKKMILLR